MERLTPSDMAMLLSEDYGWPQDIGALAILDSHELLDGDRMRLDEIRAHVGSRLHLVPRFRQLLLRPRLGLGGPLWVDAPEVDLAHHVRVRPVDPPGDEEQLLEVCEELRRRPFATDRPRWEMWLLPGLADRSIGLYVRVHHAAADGMAGMAALAAFVDTSTEIAAIRDRDPRVPDPLPSAGDLLRDNLTRRAHRLIS
ncbi:MAG TPA: wax ester/triacylglycerol synthase domain-containing protein, partial [Acidimicrobiia bacterium]